MRENRTYGLKKGPLARALRTAGWGLLNQITGRPTPTVAEKCLNHQGPKAPRRSRGARGLVAVRAGQTAKSR